MGANKSLQGVFLNDDAGNPVAVVLDGSIYRLQTIGKILNASGAQINPATQETLAQIYARQNDRTHKTQLTNGTIDVTVTNDAGINRLEILGKVALTGALPPPATNAAVIFADTPLTVGNDDTTFTIPNGETFHLQEIVAGNEDPTKGAVIEVLFDDGSEHLIARVYINGETIIIPYTDVIEARDGTSLTGNGSNEIIVRRVKYSGSNIAIDAVVRGYTA